MCDQVLGGQWEKRGHVRTCVAARIAAGPILRTCACGYEAKSEAKAYPRIDDHRRVCRGICEKNKTCHLCKGQFESLLERANHEKTCRGEAKANRTCQWCRVEQSDVQQRRRHEPKCVMKDMVEPCRKWQQEADGPAHAAVQRRSAGNSTQVRRKPAAATGRHVAVS